MEIRSYEAEPYRKIPPVEGQLKMIPPSKHQQENIYQTSLTPAETKKMYRISAQPSSLSLKGRREVQV